MWFLIWWPLKTYIIVNFRVRKINRGARKLVRIPILIKKKINKNKNTMLKSLFMNASSNVIKFDAVKELDYRIKCIIIGGINNN
jgi:hypothetical protein